jgi:transposase-like protein
MTALNAPHLHDDTKAREHLEAIRWPNGAVCPHCGVVDGHYQLAGKAHRPGLWKCRDCREQFSVTVGTVFESSKVSLSKWLMAVYLLCSSKKGISSHQLHRTLGVTYKTAWFMTHRIREAMKADNGGLLGGEGASGIVEADETYFGKTEGQGKGAHLSKKQKVVALVERKGRVRAFHVPSVNAETLKPILEGQIAKTARLMTDTAPVYSKIGQSFKSHETVNHLAKEYARGDVTTNSVEGFFGVL